MYVISGPDLFLKFSRCRMCTLRVVKSLPPILTFYGLIAYFLSWKVLGFWEINPITSTAGDGPVLVLRTKARLQIRMCVCVLACLLACLRVCVLCVCACVCV